MSVARARTGRDARSRGAAPLHDQGAQRPRSKVRTARPSPGGNTLATATKTETKLQPLGDRVVLKPTAREEMTKSGIVLPDTAKEKPQEGMILAIGPGAFDA